MFAAEAHRPPPTPVPQLEPAPEPEPETTPAGSGSSKAARTKLRASKLRGLMSGPASEITPYLFVGGSSAAQDEADLASRRITHVVNATVNEPNAYPQRCTYLRIAVPDVESTDLQRHFPKVNDFINAARAAGGKTLVHCSAGMSRSVSLALAYLIGAEGMSLVDAFRLIKTKRSIVAPNPSFMRQLAEYEVAERHRVGKLTAGPSLDVEKYAANRFGKVDSYIIEAYEESRFK